MKKVFLSLLITAFASLLYAQDVNYELYSDIEANKMLNLSADQITKIKKLNREIGPKFQEIGRSNLPGYEKGQKKRALALEYKACIMQILTKNQIDILESHYGDMNQYEGLRDIIKDNYDTRLKQLEKKYEQDVESIEDSSLPKNVEKDKLETLKKNYKSEKKRLKDERDAAVRALI